MDLVTLFDLIEENRDWEVVVLPGSRGVVVGNYDLVANFLDTVELQEREA